MADSVKPRGPVRVALIEEQAPLRRQLTKALSEAPGLAFLSAFASPAEALPPLRKLRPEVLVLDFDLPENGPALLAELKPQAPEIQVLLRLGADWPVGEERVFVALCGGASGALPKASPPERLVAAIAAVAAGGCLVDPRLAPRFQRLFGTLKRRARARNPWGLSPVERELLSATARSLIEPAGGPAGGPLSDGRCTLADLLEVFRKLDCYGHVAAVVKALEAGAIAL